MVKGTVHTTYVMRYHHGSVTITRHFKAIHEVMQHLREIQAEAGQIEIEKLVTTRTPMSKFIERLLNPPKPKNV
jgi:hypothetical protein